MMLSYLFTRNAEILINNSTHSDARVGDNNTNGAFPFEFTGKRLPDGVDDLSLETVNLSLFKPKTRTTIFTNTDKHNSTVVPMSENAIFNLGNLKLQKIKPKEYFCDGWPNASEFYDLSVMAKNGELTKLILNGDTEEYKYFPTSDEHTRIKDLVSFGVEVCWANPDKDEIWHYYDGLFMDKSLIAKLEKLSKSHMTAAFYISSVKLTTLEQNMVENAMEGFKRFNGGQGVVITGGGMNGM